MVRPERESSTYTQYSIASRPRTTSEPPPTIPPKGKLVPFGKIRPQIALGILCATVFSCLGLWIGLQLEAIEVITAIIGGLFGFLGGVSLKVLENE